MLRRSYICYAVAVALFSSKMSLLQSFKVGVRIWILLYCYSVHYYIHSYSMAQWAKLVCKQTELQ